MWPLSVEIDPPSLDDLPRFCEVTEGVFVEALVAQPSVEAFGECVLHWLAGRDVVPASTSVAAPPQHGMRCHFRSIIRDNHVRLAAYADQLVQFTDDPCPSQIRIHHSCQGFPRAIIHKTQHPEPLATLEGIGHKVQRPTLVGAIRH